MFFAEHSNEWTETTRLEIQNRNTISGGPGNDGAPGAPASGGGQGAPGPAGAPGDAGQDGQPGGTEYEGLEKKFRL